MGTVTERVAADFLQKAKNTTEAIEKFNSALLMEKLNYTHNINVTDMYTNLQFNQTLENLTSPVSNLSEFMFAVQNPTQQMREEWVEI